MARAEVQRTADTVGAMFADVGAAMSPVLFASDALGSGEASGDSGGWGLVAADIMQEMGERCLLVGLRPGLTVTKLSGEFGGSTRPDLCFRCGIPFTKLPQELFDPEITEWCDVSAGRWAYDDHITLGESRAVLKLVQLLANHESCHRRKALLLEDNMTASCAFMKGRSGAPALNFLLRKRAAVCVAA